MPRDKFELEIRKAPLWSSFPYWAYLWLDGLKIADTPCQTKWGARRWAKNMKREYLDRQGKSTLIERSEVK